MHRVRKYSCSRIYGTLRPEFGSKSEEAAAVKEFAPLCKVAPAAAWLLSRSITLEHDQKQPSGPSTRQAPPPTSTPPAPICHPVGGKVLENAEDELRKAYERG